MSAKQSTAGPTTRIRRGTVDDAGELHAVGIEVTAATYGPINEEYATQTVRRAWSVEALAASLASVPYWVAVDGETGAILGVANLGDIDGAPVLGKLYVRPLAQGRGIGGQLLAAVVGEAQGPELWLEYVAGNAAAAAFCLDQGFEEVRRHPAAGGSGLPDMVLMRRSG